MTTNSLEDATQLADHVGEQDQHGSLAGRIAELYACDPQFREADPIPAVIQAARQPGMRLTEVLQTFVSAYADRPALGQRVRHLVTDPATGRATSELLPRFDTISYRDVWARVGAIASALRHDESYPVSPGDVVASVGFASPDYLVFDLVCAYLGLVSVPLPHNAPVSTLRPIIAEVEPSVLAVGAEYLDLAVEAALKTTSLRHLIVFDYEAGIDQHRENLDRARARLLEAGMSVVVATVDDTAERGKALPRVAAYTDGSSDRLAMILYTSGSTGAPKGAMYTELMVARVWISSFISSCETPVFNVNFMPLNHIAGRLPLVSSFQSGGTTYFVPESDLSTLFEDWALVRPTEMLLVPRVADMLFQTIAAPLTGGSRTDFTPSTPSCRPGPSCGRRCWVGGCSVALRAARRWPLR